VEDIVGLIFKYLVLLKEDGVHEWIFNEVTERFMVYIFYVKYLKSFGFVSKCFAE
jgi:insulysin